MALSRVLCRRQPRRRIGIWSRELAVLEEVSKFSLVFKANGQTDVAVGDGNGILPALPAITPAALQHGARRARRLLI